MAFMRPVPFSKLSPGDFIKAHGVEWIVLEHPSEKEVKNNCAFNAVSLNGTKKRMFDKDEHVEVSRLKVHILDLRQGDQVTMGTNIGIAYNVSTVLKTWEDKDYRYVRLSRPMIFGSGFGTTCPSPNLHIEQFDTLCRVGDRKREEYYYVVGVDTGALTDAHSFSFSADQFRHATYLRANGDKREMAELLMLPYPTIREQSSRIIYEAIKHRERVPEFPDRRDDDERIYEKNLRDRGQRENDLSKAEVKYLAMCDLRKS